MVQDEEVAAAPAMPKAGHRILVLTDKVGATQSISFVNPTRSNPYAFESGDIYTQNESQLSYLSQDAYWRNEKPSVVVLSRYTEARVLPLLQLARRHGVPTIFHLDDDLLDVPMSLGAERYEFYQNAEKLQNLRHALNLVDLVYASTQPLAQRLVDHGITNDIFTGNIYCSIDPSKLVEPLPATGPVFGYMGTGGHSQDLALVIPTIARLMREMPTLRFETFGTVPPPPELAEFGSRYSHYPGVIKYEGFLQRLGELGWWVGIAPLEDNAFNRCKADTKWVEYSMAGMAVVASDLPVYHRACDGGAGLNAASSGEWYVQLNALLRDGALRRRTIASAREKLVGHYTHDALQRQLLSVIDRAAQAHQLHQSLS
jgi:glycosyltransferase involved in cell wall biosynthesis